MRKKEVKRTVEEIISVLYVADDGIVFHSEPECKKYEQSELFAVSSSLERLNQGRISMYDLNEEGSDECEAEIFNIKTAGDLEKLKRYLYLVLVQNESSEECIKECFESDDENSFKNITVGHEVIICWNYNKDRFWTYRDGSINGYLEYLRDRIQNIISPNV